MIESVDLGKRAEAYVKFAIWCRDHKMSPWLAAECVELCIRMRRKLGWDYKIKMQQQVEARLTLAGMKEIRFNDQWWPSFESPIGERTQLPMKEFI